MLLTIALWSYNTNANKNVKFSSNFSILGNKVWKLAELVINATTRVECS